MASSRKKAILRSFARDWTAGYLGPEDLTEPLSGTLSQAREHVIFLDLAGKLAEVPLASLKWVCFVRDFNLSDRADPERLLRKTFAARPRSAGLWLRLALTDGDILEGLAANDLSLLHPAGLFLTPPDTRSNTQRLFLPRGSIRALETVAVIGATATRRKPPAAVAPALQEDLFHNPEAL